MRRVFTFPGSPIIVVYRAHVTRGTLTPCEENDLFEWVASKVRSRGRSSRFVDARGAARMGRGAREMPAGQVSPARSVDTQRDREYVDGSVSLIRKRGIAMDATRRHIVGTLLVFPVLATGLVSSAWAQDRRDDKEREGALKAEEKEREARRKAAEKEREARRKAAEKDREARRKREEQAQESRLKDEEKDQEARLKAEEKERDSRLKAQEKESDARRKREEKAREARRKDAEKAQEERLKAREKDQEERLKAEEKDREAEIKRREKDRR